MNVTSKGFQLSPQQRRLWQLQRNNGSCYRFLSVLKLSGDIDVAALKATLTKIVSRHEILRTRFRPIPGLKDAAQIVSDACEFSLDEMVLECANQEEMDAGAEAIFCRELSRGFDIENGPVLRAVLAAMPGGEYLLFLGAPALCADAETEKYLAREISEAYHLAVAGCEFSGEPIQYADVSSALNQIISSDEIEAAEEYWSSKAHLGAGADNLDLPFKQAASVEGGFNPKIVSDLILPDRTGALLTLADKLGVTTADILLTCWQILISRLANTSELTVSVACNGRSVAELEGAIGLYTRYVPLYCCLDANAPFKNVALATHMNSAEVREWQDYFSWDLEPMVSDELNYCPITFDFNERYDSLRQPELTIGFYRLYSCIDRSELRLSCTHDYVGIRVEVYYDGNVILHQAARMVLKQFIRLTASVVENPLSPVRELEILDDNEKNHLLNVFSKTVIGDETLSPVHRKIEQQVAACFDRVAIVDSESLFTYGYLNSRANQAAHYLIRNGIGPEDLVAICLDRSFDFLVSLLAILKAGAAYVPIDPAYPIERMALMLEAPQIKAVITKNEVASLPPSFSGFVVNLDLDANSISSEDNANPLVSVFDDSLTYVIYTSGSTGIPKGVAITHRNLANYCSFIIDQLKLTENASFATVSTFSADLGNTVLYPSLLVGGTLHIVGYDDAIDPLRFESYFDNHPIDVLKIVPSHLNALKQGWRTMNCLPRQWLILGGEALPPRLAAELLGALSGRLLNHYGPTETTVGALIYDVSRSGGVPAICSSVPIGRPIKNAFVYLMDNYRNLAPIAAIGELCIGGDGLARGYLNRPDLTAEKFVPDRFSCRLGARLYATGDVARFTSDGNVEFLRRVDQQVKVRGFRIELREIESALHTHEAIATSLVVAGDDENGNKRLVAYVVPKQGGTTVSPLEISRFLRGKLPDYMIPSAYVELASIPLTKNGKVDYALLPIPESTRAERGLEYAVPSTTIERQLATIWAAVLNKDEIGIHENFFELGGDSILAIHATAKANEIGLKLSPKHIFQHMTIAKLAAVVGKGEANIAEQGPVIGQVPLTPIQAMIFNRDLGDINHFNLSMSLEVAELLDIDVLELALKEIVRHHDSLKTRLVRDGAAWRQYFAELDEVAPVTVFDIHSAGADALNRAAEEIQRGLDLVNGPIVRLGYMRLAGGYSRLLVVIHHIAVDIVSWKIILDDLWMAYKQLSAQGSVVLPPKTTSYKYWAERLKEYSDSEPLKEEIAYWQTELGKRVTRIPVDCTKGPNTSGSAKTISVSLTPKETRALLEDGPKAFKAQVKEVLLTAMAMCLWEFNGSNRAIMDIESHGREQIFKDTDLTRTAGWFTAVYPLMIDKHGSQPDEHLREVKKKVRSVPNGGIGYGLLKYMSSDEATRSQMAALPEAEVLFNYASQVDQIVPLDSPFKVTQGGVGTPRSPLGDRHHLLQVNAMVLDNRLTVYWTYSENFHKEATIKKVAEGLLAALRSLIASFAASRAMPYSASDFPLMNFSQDELDDLIPHLMKLGQRQTEELNCIEDIYPLTPMQQGMLFHTLYSRQAGIYFEQWNCALKGKLEIEGWCRAWQQCAARHLILRTAFVWDRPRAPFQVVYQKSIIPIKLLDWRGLQPATQQERLQQLLESDKAQGFDLSSPPLTRQTLIRIDDDTHRFVWSYHNMLLDGWSRMLLIKEVYTLYRAYSRGEEALLEPAGSYDDYLRWLQNQDLSVAESFWKDILSGYTSSAILNGQKPFRNVVADAQWHQMDLTWLGKDETEGLRLFARQNGLTLNTVVQGAWTLLLSYYSGKQDLVFMSTVSGRPAELPGVMSTVGLFINAIPVRVKVESDIFLVDWLRGIQDLHVQMRQFEYAPLTQILQWTNNNGGAQQFETLIVFENYPMQGLVGEWNDELRITDIGLSEKNNYPISLIVEPREDDTAFVIRYDSSRYDPGEVKRILESLKNLLVSFAFNPNGAVSSFALGSEGERDQAIVEFNAALE